MANLEYGKFKPITVEMSSLAGVEGLATEFDIMEDHQYEHHTVLSIDGEKLPYNIFYLTNEAIILEYNKSLYYMKLKVEAGIEDMEEMVSDLSRRTLLLETENNNLEYVPVFDKKIKMGTEKMLDSIDDGEIGSRYDIMQNMYQRSVNETMTEYLLAMIIEGELYMYVGVELPASSIL